MSCFYSAHYFVMKSPIVTDCFIIKIPIFISDPYRVLLNLQDEANQRRSDKYVAISRNLYIKSYKNNEYKISALKWNEELELPGESYSISDILDYLDRIFKKMEKRLIILNRNICKTKKTELHLE